MTFFTLFKCIYRRPGDNSPHLYVSRHSCPVLHHNTSPTWYEEIKILLPAHITPQHHLLFSFHHISCDIKKKEPANSLESSVGFAWLPLLYKGKLNIDETTLPVAASLPSGYLSIQPLGLGKGVSNLKVFFS
jgi:dedicator of cytokinesis protein 9/10/11